MDLALGRGVSVGVEMKQRSTRRDGVALTSARAIRNVLGLIVVMVLVLSLAACGSSEKTETAAPSDPNKITEADVRKVLASLDTTWSPASTGFVDVSAFAGSILKQLPPQYTATGLGIDEKAKAARIDEAVSAYKRIETERGAKVAFRVLDNIQFVGARPASAPVRKWTADELAITPLLNGLDASTLMFSHGDTPMWGWQITDVVLTGPTSAKVSYDTSASLDFVLGKANPLTFKDPTATYTKELQFERTKTGWRLVGWSNFNEFRTKLEANVQPKTLVTGFGWWRLGSAQ